MTAILFRTIILYIIVVFSMRLMGKRQIGQMELSEFVTAMMLSELAAFPISDKNIPLVYAIIPVIVLVALEVVLSFVSVKVSTIQKILEGMPTALIRKGYLDQKALNNSRITLKELLSALRTGGFSSISEAEYVFLEPNGKFSIIPKKENRPATVKDLSLPTNSGGVDHSLIIDGKINKQGLSMAMKDTEWLYKQIKNLNVNSIADILYFSVDDQGSTYFIKKENEK